MVARASGSGVSSNDSAARARPPQPTNTTEWPLAAIDRARSLESRRQRPAQFAHQSPVAGRDQLPIGTPTHAAPGHDPHILGDDRFEPARCRRHGDGARQAMLGMPLQPRQRGPATSSAPTPSLAISTSCGRPE